MSHIYVTQADVTSLGDEKSCRMTQHTLSVCTTAPTLQPQKKEISAGLFTNNSSQMVRITYVMPCTFNTMNGTLSSRQIDSARQKKKDDVSKEDGSIPFKRHQCHNPQLPTLNNQTHYILFPCRRVWHPSCRNRCPLRIVGRPKHLPLLLMCHTEKTELVTPMVTISTIADVTVGSMFTSAFALAFAKT